MIVYIYGLFDPRNDELKYIGKTVNLRIRLNGHVSNAKTGEPDPKYVWIRELLEKDLKPYILSLEECTEDNWEAKEKKWITDSFNSGVNLTNIAYGGGKDYWSGKKQSNEHIRRRVEARFRNNTYWHSDETKQKVSESKKGTNVGKDNYFYGKHHSEESKHKMSESSKGQVAWNKGVAWDDEIKEKIRQTKLGTKHSEETKRKISEGNKGKKLSPEHVEALRQANLGKVHSDETKEKLRQAALGNEHSEETKQKIKDLWADPAYRVKVLAAQKRGRELNPRKKGRKLTTEQRQAASDRRKQQWQDPEYRAKMLAAQRKRREREGLEKELVR